MTVDATASGGLLAGAAKAEITPPLEVGLLMSSVDARWAEFKGVRKPLQARALVLESPSAGDSDGRRSRVAIVVLDLLALSGKAIGGFSEFKTRIGQASGDAVAPDEIVLACTHTHTAPESGAITDLYLTPDFQSWVELLVAQIGTAIAAAAAALRPCEPAWATTTASGLGIHRRFKTTDGVLMSHPEPPAHIILSRDGAVDDSVNVLCLREPSGQVIALVVNATCHPVYEMCNPYVSPDYPGELCELLEDKHKGGVAMFLNGAAGNVNPRGVSAGAAAAQAHARELADCVSHAVRQLKPIGSPSLHMLRRQFELPSRLPAGSDVGRRVAAEIAAVSLGDVGLLFLSGEPFAETALAVRRESPFELTFVVGCSEETIGYVPTDEAFREGGYEIGFGPWSVLSPGSEAILRHEGDWLLRELYAANEPASGTPLPAPHVFGGGVDGKRPAGVAANTARSARST